MSKPKQSPVEKPVTAADTDDTTSSSTNRNAPLVLLSGERGIFDAERRCRL